MVARYEQINHKGANRLTRLFDDLLDLSMLENGAGQPNLTLTNLLDILDKAQTATRQMRPERWFVISRDPVTDSFFSEDRCRPADPSVHPPDFQRPEVL